MAEVDRVGRQPVGPMRGQRVQEMIVECPGHPTQRQMGFQVIKRENIIEHRSIRKAKVAERDEDYGGG
jgi:hypothetical protein